MLRDLAKSQRQEYFVLRIALGAMSSFCEAKFFRTVAETINKRVGRYLFFAMLFSAGMWSASVCTSSLPRSILVSYRQPSSPRLSRCTRRCSPRHTGFTQQRLLQRVSREHTKLQRVSRSVRYSGGRSARSWAYRSSWKSCSLLAGRLLLGGTGRY